MSDAPEPETREPKDLISEEDVKKTLSVDKGDDAQLISWEIVDFTKPGDNFMSFVTSIEVKYSLNNEEADVCYVAKVNPCRQFKGFEPITNLLFKKRTSFLMDIVPEINAVLEEAGKEPLHLPKCFHAVMDVDNERVFCEDLRSRGYKSFERMKALDVPHTKLVLEELAKLHAGSCLLQAKDPEETLDDKYDPTLKDWLNMDEEMNAIIDPILQSHLSHSGDILKKIGGDERALNWIESLKPNLHETIASNMQSEKFKCICHGDCWNNNFLYRYDDDGVPTEVMLVDLEACRDASLTSDLNYLMYTSLTRDVRSQNMDEFMGSYYTAFKEVMEAGEQEMPFTEEELQEDMRDKKVLGGIFAMMIVPTVLLESGDVPEFFGVPGEAEEMQDDFWAKIKEKVTNSQLLKPRFLSIFEEFMEIGIIP